MVLVLLAVSHCSLAAKLQSRPAPLQPSFDRFNEILGGGYLPPSTKVPEPSGPCETTILTETVRILETELVPTTIFNNVVVTSTQISTAIVSRAETITNPKTVVDTIYNTEYITNTLTRTKTQLQ